MLCGSITTEYVPDVDNCKARVLPVVPKYVGAKRVDPSGRMSETLAELQQDGPMVTFVSLRVIFCSAAPPNVARAF